MPESLIEMHPVLGGLIAGVLHVILGPDHLCTIVTLSACQGAEAFWFGVRWAGGHLAGMVIIGMLFTILNAVYVGNVNFEVYEHYAYYCIGMLLMGMGTYFILNADKYFDAEWSPKQASCSCHSDEPIEVAPNRFGCGYGSGDTEALNEKDPDKKYTHKPHGLREMGSAIIGFVQGIACPAGAVGMVFLKQYNLLQMLVFIAMFFTVTTLAMGLLAMSYGMLTRSCVSSKVLGRSIYYASCGMSLALGALWVFLNATGRLDEMLGHDHDHHSHDGHGHQHGHHHHTHMMHEDSHLPELLLLAR